MLRTFFIFKRLKKGSTLSFMITHQILFGPNSQYKSAFHLLICQAVYVNIEHLFPNKQVSIERETMM